VVIEDRGRPFVPEASGLRWRDGCWQDAAGRDVAWPSALRPGQWCSSPGPAYHPTETAAVSAALRSCP
jgi:hypothetical protein